MTDSLPNSRIYLHEDVAVRANQIDAYMANQGDWWSFSPELRYDCVGMFKLVRPSGRWPRGMNLWEMDWSQLEGALTEQFAASVDNKLDAAHNAWFQRSANQRSGGWDRFMVPGPGSPTVANLQNGEPRPCIVQQVVRLRLGAKQDYLDHVAEVVVPEVAKTENWRAQMWLGAMHGSTVTTLFAAPNWDGTADLGRAMPVPDPAWEANVETSFMHVWEGSALLKRGES